MAELIMELARLTGTSETPPYTWVDDLDEDVIDKLFSLLDITGLDRFEQGYGSELCSHLDSIEVDEDHNLQFLRFLRGYSGRGPCSRIVKYHCKLANLSQSFYRCVSQRQWLRTVIERQEQKQKHVITFHSNIVPRQAYLTTFEDVMASCHGNGCTGGFFPSSALREVGEPPALSCTNCALAEELRRRAHERGGLVRLRFLEEEDVNVAGDHARLGKESSEGEVDKILWRKGIFVRKLFTAYGESDDETFDSGVFPQCPSFDNEMKVALQVSHPNIVHFFGFAIRNFPENVLQWEFSLFMELLEEDLESRLLDPVQGLLSIRDSLHVLLQVAEAMKHLHEMCFVHGDLKPGNILLSRLTMPHSDVKFYLVKVADFGRTQRVDSASGATAKPFRFDIGTFGYVAPEVLSGRGPPRGDPPRYPLKVDVYSFGVVAYQVLTGATITPDILLENGYSKSGVMKPDTDELQWRLHRQPNFATLEPGRSSLLLSLIEQCSASSPESRPTFTEIHDQIQALYSRLFPPN